MGTLKVTTENLEKTFIVGVSFGHYLNESSLILDLGSRSIAFRYTRKTANK